MNMCCLTFVYILSIFQSTVFFIPELHKCSGVSLRFLKYKKYAGTPFQGGLSCIISNDGLARGLRRHNVTGECEPLDVSWFDTPVYDNGYIYLSQKRVEHSFDTSSIKIFSLIPPIIVIGSTIDVYLKSPVDNTLGGFWLDLMNSAHSKIFFHMNLRPRDSKKVVFNADINGWGFEEVKTVNPFTSQDTEYKITLKMTATAIQIKINGANFHSFGHRSPISTYKKLRYNAGRDYCERIVYTAP